MRSATKILLGLKFALGILSFVISLIYAIYIVIDVNNIATKVQLTTQEVYYSVIFMLVISIILFIGALISLHARNKLNSAYRKNELIPSIILLYLSGGIISASFILLTPSKSIISKHPYFE